MKETDFVVRAEFDEHKKNVHKKLDDIWEKISKPQFSQPQISVFLFSLIGGMAAVMVYITTIKSDARNNSTRINTVETQYENIDGKLDQLLIDVERLKPRE